ncbi:MAG: ABC transporter substrate-binding protein [Spirochaetia bacterium]|nr:ABC transporter substrate-binding protein [Spirochaetia bacterium]
MRIRHDGLTIGVAALAALIALSSACAPARPVATLRLGHAHSLKVALDAIAAERGYFAKEGLEVELVEVPAGNVAVEMLLSGELDVAEATLYPMVLKAFARDDFRIFATETVSRNDNVIAARRDLGIETIEDLKGRRVGVLKGGNPGFVLELMLLEGGIAVGDVDIFASDMDTLLAMYAEGTLDAFSCFGTWVDKAEAAHPGRTVILIDEDVVRIAMPLAAMAEDLEKRPDVYVRLLRALARAEAWLKNNPDEAFELVTGRYGLDPAVSRPLWYPDVFGVRLDQALIRDMENMARWQVETGLAPSEAMPDALALFDFRPLEKLDPKRVTIIR